MVFLGFQPADQWTGLRGWGQTCITGSKWRMLTFCMSWLFFTISANQLPVKCYLLFLSLRINLHITSEWLWQAKVTGHNPWKVFLSAVPMPHPSADVKLKRYTDLFSKNSSLLKLLNGWWWTMCLSHGQSVCLDILRNYHSCLSIYCFMSLVITVLSGNVVILLFESSTYAYTIFNVYLFWYFYCLVYGCWFYTLSRVTKWFYLFFFWIKVFENCLLFSFWYHHTCVRFLPLRAPTVSSGSSTNLSDASPGGGMHLFGFNS